VGGGVGIDVALVVGGGRSEVGSGVRVGPGEGKLEVEVLVGVSVLATDGKTAFWEKTSKTVAA